MATNTITIRELETVINLYNDGKSIEPFVIAVKGDVEEYEMRIAQAIGEVTATFSNMPGCRIFAHSMKYQNVGSWFYDDDVRFDIVSLVFIDKEGKAIGWFKCIVRNHA